MVPEGAMFAFLTKLLLVVGSHLRSQAKLQAEIVVLRRQVLILAGWLHVHPIAARSPWQKGHVERLMGSIRLNVSIMSVSILGGLHYHASAPIAVSPGFSAHRARRSCLILSSVPRTLVSKAAQ